MSTVEQIERAIERLPVQDLTKLTAWLLKRDHDVWNRQLEEDAVAGRLDVLFEEAEMERKAGALRHWPPAAE